MLGAEGKGRVLVGLGAQRRDIVQCEPWFFRTGQGTLKIQAHWHHCSERGKVGVDGSEGIGQRCSNLGVSGSHSD